MDGSIVGSGVGDGVREGASSAGPAVIVSLGVDVGVAGILSSGKAVTVDIVDADSCVAFACVVASTDGR